LRVSIIIFGIVILAISFLLLVATIADVTYLPGTVFGFVLGGLNLLLGSITRKSGGVEIPENPSSPLKLSVDKGIIGSTIYRMAFSDHKLVLKRLSSGRVTLFAALLLAVLGYAIGGLIGAAEGGVTAYAIQEFVTQRRRNVVEKGNVLDASGRGDLEFDYSDIDKVELARNRLRLYFPDRILRIVISRKYPNRMRPVLVKVIGTLNDDELDSTGKGSKEQDH
jgi:hypothetical protein